MPFVIVQNDITKMAVDAVVNAANTALKMGGGVCGAIFRAAGAEELQRECDALGGCETGQAVITKGFRLPARYIIHTPGPRWRGGGQGEEQLLRQCYINSLKLAAAHQCSSVAFPLISAGIYGFPKDKALQCAVSAITEYLAGAEDDMEVYLVIRDREEFRLSRDALRRVEDYIARHLAEEPPPLYQSLDAYPARQALPDLTDLLATREETFAQALFRLIDAKGMTDVEVYKRANIDRKLFSKIRCNPAYTPSKKTAVALAIALQLDLRETEDLLNRAGYALSRSQLFDLIIRYHIENGIYNIWEINQLLFKYEQPLLGA